MRATRRALLLQSTGALVSPWVRCLAAQTAAAAAPNGIYVCPMDPDVRASQPGVCSRCGMKLVAGLPDPVEYHMDLTVSPRPPRVGEKAHLNFAIHDPWKDRPVTHYQIVHEKLFHMFVVSQDLQFFVHDHPTGPDASGDFDYDIVLPKPGLYRVVGDFYPDGATPQLIVNSLIVPGKPPAAPILPRDYSTKNAGNMQVAIRTDPEQPLAGQRTLVYFTLNPVDGFEKYLGAWAHMLVASDDLIDMIHTHPLVADGGPQVQFTLVFPRARTFRIWVQFQRRGVVNTAHFDIPVTELE